MVAAVFPSIAAAKWWMNGCHSSDSVDLSNKYPTPNMGIILKRCMERKALWEGWSSPVATVVVAGQSVAVAGTEDLVSTLHWCLGTTPRTPFDRG